MCNYCLYKKMLPKHIYIFFFLFTVNTGLPLRLHKRTKSTVIERSGRIPRSKRAHGKGGTLD